MMKMVYLFYYMQKWVFVLLSTQKTLVEVNHVRKVIRRERECRHIWSCVLKRVGSLLSRIRNCFTSWHLAIILYYIIFIYFIFSPQDKKRKVSTKTKQNWFHFYHLKHFPRLLSSCKLFVIFLLTFWYFNVP